MIRWVSPFAVPRNIISRSILGAVNHNCCAGSKFVACRLHHLVAVFKISKDLSLAVCGSSGSYVHPLSFSIPNPDHKCALQICGDGPPREQIGSDSRAELAIVHLQTFPA